MVAGKPIKLDKSIFLSMEHVENVPEDSEDLINLIFQDDSEFRRHIKNRFDFELLIKKLPSVSHLISDKAFADKIIWVKIIHYSHDTINLRDSLPNYSDKIITSILNVDILKYELYPAQLNYITKPECIQAIQNEQTTIDQLADMSLRELTQAIETGDYPGHGMAFH